ncbi:hypothetical protein [Klebsiella pneumoniae]|uniref:hypothetical protein n=1 Tax=Klebsiella pneumoniae TaxID=573 RepID=UPI000B0F570A|nr:hypothetical protein [Klebsiella pneumoniae]
MSKESIQRSKDVYGIVNLSELQPVHLYNIQTINAHGYAVIDNNVSLQEQKKGLIAPLTFKKDILPVILLSFSGNENHSVDNVS